MTRGQVKMSLSTHKYTQWDESPQTFAHNSTNMFGQTVQHRFIKKKSTGGKHSYRHREGLMERSMKAEVSPKWSMCQSVHSCSPRSFKEMCIHLVHLSATIQLCLYHHPGNGRTVNACETVLVKTSPGSRTLCCYLHSQNSCCYCQSLMRSFDRREN